MWVKKFVFSCVEVIWGASCTYEDTIFRMSNLLIFFSPVFEFVCNWDNGEYHNGVNCGGASQWNVIDIAVIIQMVFS